MAADELRPGGVALAFRGRSQPEAAQNIADRLIRNLVAQIGQGANDAIIAPTGVILGQLHNEPFQHGIDGRATDGLGTSIGEIPLLGHQTPVPFKQGCRLDNRDDLGQQLP